MEYIIYSIRNKLNGKIYIGAHRTENIQDNYMGSGIAIRKAIKKYGKYNFSKTILLSCSSEEEMYSKEAELVSADFIQSEGNYNASVGGKKGPSTKGKKWINNGERNKYIKKGDPLPEGWVFGPLKRNRKIIWITDGINNSQHPHSSPIPVGYTRGITRDSSKGMKYISNGIICKRWNTKNPLPEGFSYGGKNNGQEGTMWITDGTSSKKISKNAKIPKGYRKGRTIK